MTIYALSTAPGRAGIAVIRISGKMAQKALVVLCKGNIPAPRFAGLRKLHHPQTGEIIDSALVLWFPAPASFTGEDMAELHVHGGRAVISGCMDALAALDLRLAEPGEFTRRAFEHGKLDLTEAEGLADLVNAQTAAQRRLALAQASGALRNRYEAWRGSLLRAMAYVEVSLDFSDEGDIAEDAFNAALPEVRALLAELDRTLDDGRRGEILREGIRVTIIGAPNAGKSSLLNALAGREAAIVYDEPGTTRDVIEVSLDLDGYPFVVRDTAGLRETASPVEQEGIRRALAVAEGSDIVMLIQDITSPDTNPLSQGEQARDLGAKLLVLHNKVDLAPSLSQQQGSSSNHAPIPISAKTGQGLDTLKSALVAFAQDHYGLTETPLITRARHRQEIEEARRALLAFLDVAKEGGATELAAEDLRIAADALARLTGRLDVEDVLGQIFSEFCIGK